MHHLEVIPDLSSLSARRTLPLRWDIRGEFRLPIARARDRSVWPAQEECGAGQGELLFARLPGAELAAYSVSADDLGCVHAAPPATPTTVEGPREASS
jgi:hypothetical protein